MIDLQAYLKPKIVERCKTLRNSTTYSQGKITDKAAICRIERNQDTTSGNFITDANLHFYFDAFSIKKQEIVFGNDDKLEELLEEIFSKFFELISVRNLDADMNYYKENVYNELDIMVQKAVISLANSFAEYNLQRHNFIKIEDAYMSSFARQFDKNYFINGKIINIARATCSKPLNEKTVIDNYDMEEKIWLVCKDKIISSFKTNVIDVLFEPSKNPKTLKDFPDATVFKFTSINDCFYKWVKKQFIGVIVPEVVDKLKSNSIFKIGYMVESLINGFWDEDLPKSFQKTIPVKTKIPHRYRMNFKTPATINEMNCDDVAKIHQEAKDVFLKNQIPDLSPEEIKKFESYGITFAEAQELNLTTEVNIETVINEASISRYFNKIKSDFEPMVEVGPIIKMSDFKSQNEIDAFYDNYYNITHLENLNIPGYLTNNSQIICQLQERLNKNIMNSVEEFIIIQNNLLRLLTNEELTRFAK